MRAVLLAALALSLAAACSSESTDDREPAEDAGTSSSSSSSSSSSGAPSSGGSGGSTTSLRGRVQAIMDAKCSGCHGSEDPEALLDLGDVGNLINAESFELPGQILVKPGAPDESVLVLAVEGNPPGALERMPQRGPALPKTQTDAIRQWVQDGAE